MFICSDLIERAEDADKVKIIQIPGVSTESLIIDLILYLQRIVY